MDYYGKGSISNNNKLLPIILLVASVAQQLLLCLSFRSLEYTFYFSFYHYNLQFALVNKKAQAAQRKKAMECRGSPLAIQ
jgi:hypothetical protein